MKDIINESIRYWEPRRIAYNVILALVVVASTFYHHQFFAVLDWQPLVGLLLCAVVANVLYCSAYAADLLLQMSDYQSLWRRCRWLIWVLGTAFAIGVFLLHE